MHDECKVNEVSEITGIEKSSNLKKTQSRED